MARWSSVRQCLLEAGALCLRWEFDGTYIAASDSKTVPWERTYWTDDNGRLVGKAKGHPGQKRTVAPWEPRKPAPAEADIADVYLTGYFGPLASVLRRL
ncbi:hypothetical protein GCM10010425_74370 [Streptomyces spororaveus]|uniref:Uncharacterized protein n=1 Tax=Streptomyces spororaveus TaxID=284039 RepID=A0ABQ3T250_9ACTN|nr:hypothetical protein [Streptomyces spororaveus]GHI74463.1 hypothetical protein Sspor_00240 [Streptomyces spororaveus]